MALWCLGFPRVTVPWAKCPKPITLVMPYYENPAFFRQQCDGWWTIPEALRPYISVIVVDDGSPEPIELPVQTAVSVKAFRIGQDVRWNWLAARNIGAHHAKPGWLLMTDIDHVVPPSTFEALVWGQHDPAVAYAFIRHEHTGLPIHPHSASFFMTRDLFWKVGGYDEALSGYYGTDGEYRRRLAAHAQIQILNHELVRHEYVGDSSTTRYQRKQSEDGRVRQLIAARGKSWQPKVLSFPYQEVMA